MVDTPKRQHKATYAKDKKKGGYLVRVIGPRASEFAGRSVPVVTRDDQEHQETLTELLWSGPDMDPGTKQATGQQAALYAFEPKPREDRDEIPF